MKKNNAKSIGLSDKVLNYIMAYRGDGFNEKFENIILDFMESEADWKRQMALYDNLIADQKKRYYTMCDKLSSLDPMVQACLHINSRIRTLNVEFDSCISDLPGFSPDLQKK